jgi:phage-related minor tail protein
MLRRHPRLAATRTRLLATTIQFLEDMLHAGALVKGVVNSKSDYCACQQAKLEENRATARRCDGEICETAKL